MEMYWKQFPYIPSWNHEQCRFKRERTRYCNRDRLRWNDVLDIALILQLLEAIHKSVDVVGPEQTSSIFIPFSVVQLQDG